VVGRLFFSAIGFALPSSIWIGAFEGVLLALLGARLLVPARIPATILLLLSALAFAYGAWTAWSIWPILSSLSAVAEGDAVALEAASGIGFMVIGALALLAGLFDEA
jgi:hypothetical protein